MKKVNENYQLDGVDALDKMTNLKRLINDLDIILCDHYLRKMTCWKETPFIVDIFEDSVIYVLNTKWMPKILVLMEETEWMLKNNSETFHRIKYRINNSGEIKYYWKSIEDIDPVPWDCTINIRDRQKHVFKNLLNKEIFATAI
jgi:hypothetical protein